MRRVSGEDARRKETEMIAIALLCAALLCAACVSQIVINQKGK